MFSTCFAFSVNGLSVFTVDEFTYAELNDDSFVAVYDWNATKDEAVIPDRVLGKYVLSVYEYAFFQNEDLKAIDFSSARHLNYIDSRAFSESGLNDVVTMPASLRSLGFATFQDCKSLKGFISNSSLIEIPDQAFYGCESLETVVLSPNVSTIRKFAFANCSSLTEINISNSVKSIDDTAFNGADNVVIRCDKESYAYLYCLRNGISYRLNQDTIPYILGDVNGDGVVDILDATEIQKYAAERTDFTDEQFELGDINKDGYCDVIDALLVQKSVIGAYEIPPIVVRY